MTISAESRLLNIRRSFNKHVHTKLVTEPSSPVCYINYGELSAEVPPSYNTWISIYWLPMSGRVYTEGRVQINIQSKVIIDKMGNKVTDLADTVMGIMNVNTITLYDFADPQNLVDLAPYLLIPRLEDVADLPTVFESQIRGILLDYKVYLSLGSVLD